jgi:K+-transporting ATPase KdpF subunit
VQVGGEEAMNLLYVVGGVASLGLFVYLLYALLRAEDF